MTTTKPRAVAPMGEEEVVIDAPAAPAPHVKRRTDTPRVEPASPPPAHHARPELTPGLPPRPAAPAAPAPAKRGPR